MRSDLQGIYQRIGGEKALRLILHDFYSRMAEDIMIGFFFDGKDLAAIAQKQGDFLMRAMGARESFSGKAPAQAHLEIAPILSGHFDRRLQILEDTLRAHKVTDEDIRTWVEFESLFRAAIVSS